MHWEAWDRATRIAGLHQLLHTVAAVRDMPDDDPRVAALVELLAGIAASRPTHHRTEAATPLLDFDADESAIQYFERRVRAGLVELQAYPLPRAVQWVADRYVAAQTARGLHAERRRLVPPSVEGRIAELRQHRRRP